MFVDENDRLRSDAALLGMWLICQARKVNFLLDVLPDHHGVIPQQTIDALQRLRKNYERVPA